MSEMITVVGKLQTLFKELDKTSKKDQHEQKIKQINSLKQKMIELIDEMPEGYYKNKYLKDLKEIDNKIAKSLAKVSSKNETPVTGEYTMELPKRQVTNEDVLIKIVEVEVSSKDLKLQPKEVQELLDKMRSNQQVMEQVQEIVKDTGDNIEKLDDNIEKAYQNVKDGNKNLDEANKISIATRIMQIRLFAGGIFAFIGNKFFGIFGLIGGLFAGFKTGSVLKQ